MKHFTDQIALTVIAEINENLLDTLKEKLNEIYIDVADNALLPLARIKGIHFCRFVILPKFIDSNGKHVPPQLVYSANIDNSTDTHLLEIKNSKTSDGFKQLFECCSGFDKSLKAEKAVERFIRKNEKKVHTFYRGHRGLSVDSIKSEKELNETIQTFLDSHLMDDVEPNKIKNRIEEHIKEKFPNRENTEPIKLPNFSLVQTGLILVIQLLLPIALLLTACCFLGVFWYGLFVVAALLTASGFYLRFLEIHDVPLKESDRSYDKIRKLSLREDKIVQNQLTHLVPLKEGKFRKILQLLALWALNQLAVNTFNKGRLGDIGTIHFARWSSIDKGQRLLFFSNFDGSWENYLGDFVDRAAVGLTLAWSNTKEFPSTKWLILNGATNEELFKSWARKYQLPTQVWYSAYKDLTVKDIYRNHKIALGIGKKMSEKEIKDWLKLL